MVEEPATVMNLGGLGSEQEKVLGSRTGHREFAFDAAPLVEHGGERDPSDCGHAIREQRRKPRLRPLPGHFVFCEVRDLGEAHPLSHRPHLVGDNRERVGPTEGHVLERRLTRALKPKRVFEAERCPPHGVGLGERPVDRSGV